jgi:HK97 family phage major capsid protein
MEDGRTLLRKAELAVADFTTGGGLLQPQQVDEFIRLAIKEPVLLQMMTVTPMRGPKEERDKMRFANRVLKPGTEGAALPSGSWAKPDLSLFTLDAQLFKAEVRITNEALEDQIERGSFEQTLMQELSKAIGRDMEFVVIQGDTASADPLLAKLDGLLKQATANQVDAASATLDKAVLRDMLKALPDEFARDASRMRYLTNRQARVDYRDSVADRATGLGDLYLTTMDRTQYSDIPVVAVPEFPVSGGNTNVLLADPANYWLGIHRDVRIQTDQDISAGVVIIVASVRFDTKIAEVNAVAEAINVSGT